MTVRCNTVVNSRPRKGYAQEKGKSKKFRGEEIGSIVVAQEEAKTSEWPAQGCNKGAAAEVAAESGRSGDRLLWSAGIGC